MKFTLYWRCWVVENLGAFKSSEVFDHSTTPICNWRCWVVENLGAFKSSEVFDHSTTPKYITSLIISMHIIIMSVEQETMSNTYLMLTSHIDGYWTADQLLESQCNLLILLFTKVITKSQMMIDINILYCFLCLRSSCEAFVHAS